MKENSGEILTASVVFFAIAIIICMLVITIFVSHINSVLYNFKLEMYSLNRSAIIAVNKTKTSVDNFSYNIATYKNEFVKLLKSNYELDENLENENKLISGINIVEYKIYNARSKDSFSKKNLQDRTIHMVLEVKIKPIILKSLLENIFVFTIHEDVALNSMIVDER